MILYRTPFQAVVAVVVSNVVGEAQLPIAHEQARQKFEFHKNTHRNEKELRFTLLYHENCEVSRLITEEI